MPYSMREENGRYCVYKRNEKLKCYDTKAEASDYLAALEMHADEKQSSAGHYRALARALLQVHKYGRVLSRANEQEITSALTALITVLRRAGIELEGTPMDAKSLIERLEEKAVDPETAQIVADVINQMVQEIDTQLGITEVLQGQQEQPVDEDGNPIEQDPNAEQNQDENSDQKPPPDEQQQDETDSEGNPKKKPPYKKSKAYWLEQSEVNYTPDAIGDKHCSSCRWFIPQGEFGSPSCTIVATWPAPIVANGVCDRHETLPTYEAQPLQVEVVGQASATEITPSAITAGTSFVQNLKATISNAFTRVDKQSPESNFIVFKGADGRHYWLARHTNNIEDRDEEILSGKSHDGYAARVKLNLVDKPELWSYHGKGSRQGIGDLVWTYRPKDYPEQCFVFALGHFDDTPEGKRAFKFYQNYSGQIELSHGFTYPSWALKDGVYYTYNTFEISTLPKGRAANPYVRFEEIKAMALDEIQRQWVKDTVGEDALKRVEEAHAKADADSEVLTAMDKRYKNFGDVLNEKDGEITVDLKKVLKVVAELIDAQGELEALVKAANEEATAQKTARESLEQKIATLEAQLKLRPRSASRAKETEIEGENALSEALKKVTEDEYIEHPTWGRLKPKR